eukprot:1914233-Pyramimonas_sp.AAC.1
MRVVKHVEEKSRRCRHVLLGTFQGMPPHVAAGLDRQDADRARKMARKGRRRHHVDTGVERL